MFAAVHQNSIGSVAIMAAEPSDSRLIENLLKSSRLGAENISICNIGDLPENENFALVLCHRHNQDSTDNIMLQCKEISRLIVLSDCTAESTVVNLLENGARHVFDLHEQHTVLQARLEAALRQYGGEESDSFTVDDIQFDMQKRKVFRAGKPVDLSPKEFEFASRIFINVDEVVKNSELMTSVWSLPQNMDTRRIDTAACRVRKKLKLFSDEGWLLKRIRCVGYRLTRVSPEVQS